MKAETQRKRLERCQKDIDAHPEKATAHYNLGLALTISGRVKQAEETYLKAVELDPSLVKAWVNLGGVRMLHWDFQGCLEANQEAARLQDDLVIAHFNMGQAYLYLNDPENLIRCNKRVLEIERDHPAAHYYAAVGYLATSDLGATERHLGRAIELGHSPTHDFFKAMEKAHTKKFHQQSKTLIEITGEKTPDSNHKEE
uniref:Protein containing a tetratricopeptide repeat n=1 Tax=uncultured sulfate-reducing bacterium TaxID=153939 RepID=Q3IBS5_9BACT|nr:protein containing a tetratricopeptide repeat [uncultured sulfate-reducing bacterium]